MYTLETGRGALSTVVMLLIFFYQGLTDSVGLYNWVNGQANIADALASGQALKKIIHCSFQSTCNSFFFSTVEHSFVELLHLNKYFLR